MRCRNHSRATKIGQRMWKRNALCSNGEPCRSRIRKRISPSSESSISVLRRANETRAPLTTERSSAIAPSSRTKPWSRTSMVLSGITSVTVTAGGPYSGTRTVPSCRMAIKVGTSGWSYPSWRPGFYPDGLQPTEFLSFYAERFDTVELNSTGYRLPSGRPVPPLGRRRARRVRVLRQVLAHPARPRDDFPRARARARRPARPGAGRLHGAARRRDALLRPRLRPARTSAWRGTSATRRGAPSTASCR